MQKTRSSLVSESEQQALSEPRSRLHQSALGRLSAGLAAAFIAVACGGSPEVTNPGTPSAGGAAGTGGSAPIGEGGTGLIIDVPGGGTGGTTDPTEEGVCGDKVLAAGELCDDGNTTDGDGCSADCKVQDPNFDCSKVGEPCVNQVICGNSRIEGDEVCDDGNVVAEDGCAADCKTVETGFACPRPGKPCVALSVCGNGVRERGEQCDDKNTTPDDGCTETCQLQDGFFCVPGQACVALVCGDGNRTPDEACDDNNKNNGDGCSSTCTVEAGYLCSATGCATICGDGLIKGTEKCDDGNRDSGDGCSSACVVEPFTSCTGTPSKCTSTIVCGNSKLEPGEICDPPGTGGCLAGCKSFSPTVGGGSTCGNNVIEAGETCDPPMAGNGCSAGCSVESGWSCPFPGVCFEEPTCGDGVLHTPLSEQCDDGDKTNGDGCNSSCQIESGWSCTGLEPSTCTRDVCGNGVRTGNEQCDDGNTNGSDGCTASCQVSTGWACPIQNKPCLPVCGDGQRVGSEECDDRNTNNSDGCSAACRVEPGFTCPNVGQACVRATCGNGTTESGEGCDDGNKIAGDGCGPTCQKEPTVTVGTNPTVAVACGDGLKTGSEQCDDGNVTNGDGCSSTCAIEFGYTCEELVDLPSSIDMRVTYRDFKSGNAPDTAAANSGGHPDFQYGWLDHVPGIAGAPCTTGNTGSCGRLDAQGKPALALSGSQATTGIRDASTFALWYRNTNASNVQHNGRTIGIRPVTSTLRLTQVAAGSETYVFENPRFFPLDGVANTFGPIGGASEAPKCNGTSGIATTLSNPGCDVECGLEDIDPGPGSVSCQSHNFGFTTELRYFFQYRGGETLSFYGDDDVWVFVNGRLAVDIGGLHQQRFGRVVLGDDGNPGGGDSNCSLHATTSETALGSCYSAGEQGNNTDSRFGLTKGNVYEIVLFHAERQTAASNFKLTLSGFLAPRSYCTSTCGDGKLASNEVCDDGVNNKDNVSGACNKQCKFAYCGDGTKQSNESCDNGKNTDLYGPGTGKCAPGCVQPARCGDGTVQSAFEQCDRGAQNNDNAYGPDACKTNCQYGGYCGDGVKQTQETCDQGINNGKTYGPNSCGYDCTPGPRCGDNVRNGPEECDGSENCSADCKLQPFCGDGVKSATEECDYGQFGSPPASVPYGGCSNQCKLGPSCGDATVQKPQEECDLGTAANTNAYNGCSENCTFGPRCGDAVRQEAEGEACDNGFNQDTYAFTPNACGPNCTAVPACGDGVLQSAYELCDLGAENNDTTYDGCTTTCEFGPYCGDGEVTAPETCDNGPDNRAYSTDASSCGYDCQPAPYCGDGERNGPEQCDLGTTNNTGEYGKCNANCTLAPRCGDGVLQSDAGEQCDDGPAGSFSCSTTCVTRGPVR